MSAVIEWSDPPPRVKAGGGRRGLSAANRAIAEALIARPGQWAKIGERRSSSAGTALVKTFQRFGRFEAKVRQVDGRRFLWMRYVGPAIDPATVVVKASAVVAGTDQLADLVRPIAVDPAVKSNVVALPPAKTKTHPSTQPAPKKAVDPFECELCDPPKVFTDRHTLRHHQRVSHRGAS